MKLYNRYEKYMSKYNLFNLQQLDITQDIQAQFWRWRDEVLFTRVYRHLVDYFKVIHLKFINMFPPTKKLFSANIYKYII